MKLPEKAGEARIFHEISQHLTRNAAQDNEQEWRSLEWQRSQGQRELPLECVSFPGFLVSNVRVNVHANLLSQRVPNFKLSVIQREGSDQEELCLEEALKHRNACEGFSKMGSKIKVRVQGLAVAGFSGGQLLGNGHLNIFLLRNPTQCS